jgi:hypothetical protein
LLLLLLLLLLIIYLPQKNDTHAPVFAPFFNSSVSKGSRTPETAHRCHSLQ